MNPFPEMIDVGLCADVADDAVTTAKKIAEDQKVGVMCE